MAGEASLPALLLWLLPAAFILHDAEEAVFLPSWLCRNRPYLMLRFPALSRRVLPHFDAVSPARFAAMAAEELTLLLAVTLYARITHDYYPWLALLLAFGVHLLVHLVQWAAAGRYFPAAATSLAGLVYCAWGVYVTINSRLFTLREFVVCGVTGCAVATVNLLLLHRLFAKSAANSDRNP